MPVKGSSLVSVCQDDQTVKFPLLIVENKGPSMFGGDWLQILYKLNWPAIFKVGTSSLQEFFSFKDTQKYLMMGWTLQNYNVKVYIDPKYL